MLNYLGPNIGPRGPIATQLPPATPGSMPGAVPHVASTPLPLPAARIHPAHAIHAHGAPPSAAALGAILSRPGMVAPPDQGPPPLPEYGTTTQEDGSILLHLQNPDGSKGPVVKVIPPIKRSGPQGA
jgi:hypothetical protein